MESVHLDLPDDTAAPAQLTSLERMSEQLGQSQALLHQQVHRLRAQLDQASAERVQQADETERLARRLRNLVDLLPGGVIVLDGHGLVSEANPVAIDLLGEPLIGSYWREVIQRCFAPRPDDGHEISLKDGRRVAIATRSLDGEPGQLVLLTDMTETRRLQGQLARHERLSSLGRMVASLAHQIRTPLSAALLYAGHLADESLDTAQQQRFAGKLKERLHELDRQVRDMLIFARGELPLSDRVRPRELLRALQAAAEPHLEGINVRWQNDAYRGELACNRDTLVSALLNLIDNARQAGGKAVALKVHCFARGDALWIGVCDNGPGIEPTVLARLGEPFFTTKATGTGLGLAVVKAIARAHHGELLLSSRPGRGTWARLRLPLLSAIQAEERA